jgi:hypothetical protein
MTTATHTKSLAEDYADSMSATIWADYERGYLFGYDEEREKYAESAELSAYDYLDDVLDIEYRVDSGGGYRSAEVLIGYGGPNVSIDTRRGVLVVSWDTVETRSLPREFVDALDVVLAELWEMR